MTVNIPPRSGKPGRKGFLIRAPYHERKHDLYESPSVSVTALLRVENMPAFVWEPACGRGAIARVLRQHGRRVLATDLVDYDSPDQDFGHRDFLLEQKAPEGAGAIATNPPYRLAGEFVEHSLLLCPLVFMLLRLTFLESTRRTSVLESGYLARVHIFRNRLPMLHRDGWEGPRVSNPTAYAWFVWDRSHKGPATINRISWTPDRL